MNPRNLQQYIGIRCGDLWCEVREDRGGASSPSYDGSTPNDRAVFGIKGWYDEQPLSEFAVSTPNAFGPPLPPTPGKLIPTIMATVVPEPILQELRSMDAFNDKWVRTARVHIRGSAAKYQATYGFRPGSLPDRMNEISLCRGHCGLDSATVCPSTAPSGTTERLFAKIKSAGTNDTTLRCVEYRQHEGHGPRMTARWRWPWEAPVALSVVSVPEREPTLTFGMPAIVLPTPTMLDGGFELLGIWHWCPDGCCTIR
jgi:hypothetical protein